MSTTYAERDWHAHYEAGRDFRPLTDVEKSVLTEHLALSDGDAPDARALDVACGTGELARFLATSGYRVDAVDWAEAALQRATAAASDEITYHQLDVTGGDVASLDAAGHGYRVITVRRALAHLPDRTRTVAELAALLDEDGTLCVISPHADRHPAELRRICLDNAEMDLLADGWQHTERIDAGDSTILLLRGPKTDAVAYSEKRTPKPAAMAGVAVVVTNDRGQVLLGWNPSRGMWELPAGKVEPGEAFEATAVRELAEEAGLHARPEAVLLLGTLCDATHGFTRITEVARITDHTGEPTAREPELISRWEWHSPSDLRSLPQPLFTASAQALNVAWPGLLPEVPAAHHTPRPAGEVRLTFAEPAAAVRLRERLVRDLTEAGWTDTPELQRAFTTVPRHAFLPEQPLARAYANEAIATVFDEDTGQSMSSVSQPEMQALMLRQAGLRPGHRVLEIGGGGYNACLIAELVGPSGSVVCVEIDPYVHARTERFLAETGYADRVRPFLGDGGHGAPSHLLPEKGFDAILVTVAAKDVPRAWTAQLAEGGHLVLPLRLGGYTRAVGLRNQGGTLYSTGISACGFVPMQGVGRWDETPVAVGEAGYGICWEDTPPAPLDGLDRAIAAGRVELWTGVTVRGGESFEDLQLWLASSLPGFCRMTGDPDRPGPVRLPKRAGAEAIVLGRSLACLMVERRECDEATGASTWEFGVQGFGPDGKAAAESMAAAVHTWDRELRGHAVPALTVLPTGTADGALPAGDVVEKADCRIVVSWPGRDGAADRGVGQDARSGGGNGL
ncbi:methyltransferase, FxLD system [Streptomyces bambusae]|uniref:Protein-L-isoaspartate O-methyltransferase n=1 Tax=Streptomyces bambusae TaxID=1550616 RepID=A0ABS6YZC9_9ACTN|nr:methyltransferase, FxLD system [Streptomyces bambusae]MBW5480802.1 methyltransferase, FxLD system [Streptomyces bambusae]